MMLIYSLKWSWWPFVDSVYIAFTTAHESRIILIQFFLSRFSPVPVILYTKINAFCIRVGIDYYTTFYLELDKLVSDT